MGGRPRIAPEKRMRAMLLRVLHSIRSECRQVAAYFLQSAAPLIHRAGYRRHHLEALRVLQEPQQPHCVRGNFRVVYRHH